MSSTAKVTTGLIALVVATQALAGCVGTPVTERAETPAPSPATEPVATIPPSPESAEEDACAGLSHVTSQTDDWRWERGLPLTDLGAPEYARGEVALDEHGAPTTYTVEPGDVEAVIAERLCAYPNLSTMNHVREIHPGQVLWLTPDPDSPWVPYDSPLEAEAGFSQIAYQDAMTAAGAAVDAGDIATVREIWNGTLSDMFTDQDTIDAIQQVIDSGDPDALRQLFS